MRRVTYEVRRLIDMRQAFVKYRLKFGDIQRLGLKKIFGAGGLWSLDEIEVSRATGRPLDQRPELFHRYNGARRAP